MQFHCEKCGSLIIPADLSVYGKHAECIRRMNDGNQKCEGTDKEFEFLDGKLEEEKDHCDIKKFGSQYRRYYYERRISRSVPS